MVMKGIKYLVLLAVAALFVACNKESGVGLELQEDLMDAQFTDTLSVNISTMLDNRKITTEGSNITLIGSTNDPLLGKTNVLTYFEITENTISSSDALTCDSIVLRLSYFHSSGEPVVYGDTSTATHLSLYNLSEDFVADTSYSSIHSLANETTDYLDSNVFFTPTDDLLTLYLPTTLGQDMLDANNTETFEDDYHGLVIKAENGEGAIVGIDLIDADSEIEIYYHSSIDTNSMIVNIENTTHFHAFTYDRSSTEFSDLNAIGTSISSEASSGASIVQSGTGLSVLIDVPHLKTFLTDIDPATINKAVLTLHVDNTTTGAINTSTPGEVVLVKTESNNLVWDDSDALDIVLNDSSLVASGGANFNYNASDLTYELTIGLHLQDLLAGDDYYELALYSNEISTASKAVILDRFNSDASLRPKLEIYYTTK
jgi:hypothetical protein